MSLLGEGERACRLTGWFAPASICAAKERAGAALEAMGLSISDAVRLLRLRIAGEQRLPFEVKVPNATTPRAMDELEQGKGRRFESAGALLEDLDI